MIERNNQFNFAKVNREMEPGGYWLLRCDKNDLLEKITHFADVLRIKTNHEEIRSHHVSVEPHPS